jgi:hypothetical protein
MISNKLVVIAAFNLPFEAHIAKVQLEAADIPSFIADEHMGGLQYYANAIGGVRLLVPRNAMRAAHEALANDFQQYLEELPDPVHCRQCGSENTAPDTQNKFPALITLLLLGVPLLFPKVGMSCEDCQHFESN